ncbi:cupredoxin domain-containing protein [Solirubrobacter ginsenosidimutans]|uniref:Cupredoxin domain-containing protein n=1 Tax=Solirubrobacter ginsenosidimutans TaxID=490573 RepID=A0A9X3MQP5_9ACTN|nr:cupredoxin domain-containing protein [Solirubrobacter ginsenosidimutans]MDA0161181.1 cupredoxin domain-containing protein [Solirubrobacter ginsenosidimutans]
MIRRVLVGGLAAAALLVPAAGAQASVTRAVQAFDTPSFTHLWTPRNVPAQVGDTIEWRFTQPGNPLGENSTHDVWVVAPGGQPQQLGASYLGPKASTVVSQAGTYQFYCSIHGGLAAGGMNGQVVVGTADPGAPVDPGTPWTDPDWVDPDDPSLPPALPNTTTAPTVFEEGDTTAPTVDLISIKAPENTVKVKVNVSEAGTLTLRLKLGKKVVATETVDANAGPVSAQIKPPKNLRDKERKYKLQVFATDMAEIDSKIHSVWVYLGG